jgi:hypothetical protein
MIRNYFANKATNAIEDFLKEKNISTTEYNIWQNEHRRLRNNFAKKN